MDWDSFGHTKKKLVKITGGRGHDDGGNSENDSSYWC